MGLFRYLVKKEYLLRLETVKPCSIASLHTCEPTNPFPPKTSSLIKCASKSQKAEKVYSTKWKLTTFK